ncbi:sugar ABC transporter permease [Paenibacillus rhizovicinus]|uniref:Sugar ABC transporter permease n=2 Tax=Paenibacillus rhizovicinus TaxID=2704463 RepID=A0A6C0P9N1_9BACL|nr:sugar ABC transporter permease [Paenibacillus rhizovicinus]
MKRNYPYYLMMLPAALIMFLFSYLPMPGMIVAFQDFNFVDRFKSPFVGWDNFKFFFTSSYAYRTTFNTIFINLNYLVWTTFVSVLFAILLNEIRSKLATKFYQNMMFLPYFFSAVVVGKLVTDIVFSDQNGIANQILHLFGHDPIVWSQVSGPWGWIIIGTHIWKTAGYSSIIYLASIAGIDDHLYEAASLDGATRWQQIRTITLPMLTPVIIIMTLLSIGSMLRGDFDTIYSIVGDNGLLFAHTDVIDTYIFRAIKQAADFGPTAAVGLYQSVVGFVLVFGSNALVKRYNKDSALF